MGTDRLADMMGALTPGELAEALMQVPATALLYIIYNRVKDAESVIEDIEKTLVNYKEDK